jgi:hypothetical protein
MSGWDKNPFPAAPQISENKEPLRADYKCGENECFCSILICSHGPTNVALAVRTMCFSAVLSGRSRSNNYAVSGKAALWLILGLTLTTLDVKVYELLSVCSFSETRSC